jgi:hypothetical protein
MLMYSGNKACFEHSNFLKVKGAPGFERTTRAPARTRGQPPPGSVVKATAEGVHAVKRTPPARVRGSTTSFLTATTLIYAIGAGITAAAGTRLALQLFLVKGFRLYSLQLCDPKESHIVIYCHYLPVSGLGNLRACCLPWMW